MQDFEWISDKPLRAEIVARITAVFGIFFAVSCILLVLGYKIVSAVFMLLGIIFAIVVLRNTNQTRIKVEGSNLFYGTSTKANLVGLREIKLQKQFLVMGEEVIVLLGEKAKGILPIRTTKGVIPTYGIPSDIKSKLISVLEERISAEIN